MFNKVGLIGQYIFLFTLSSLPHPTPPRGVLFVSYLAPLKKATLPPRWTE